MKRVEPHHWLKMTADWRALPGWLALAGLAAGAYLGAAALGYGVIGFPLDDAWIHQTYARNLAATGQWAFVPGQISAGSTSPLWSLLLGLGYWMGFPYQAWSYALGILALALTGWAVARLGTALFPAATWVGPLAGLLCVWEWHLVWAAVSGMETIWFIWLSVLLVEYQISHVKYQSSNVESQTTAHRPQTPALVPERTAERGKAVHAKGVHSDSDSLPSGKPSTPKVPIVAPEHSLPSGKASIVIVSAGASAADRESPTSNLQSPPARAAQPGRVISNLHSHAWYLRFGILGFLGGLLTLTRPEGLVLVGLTGLATSWELRHAPARLLRAWAALAIGLALPLAPYLVFHYSLTGLPFPNTFYAKQQEYRAALALYPFWQRWLMMAAATLTGGQVLLLPGFLVAIWRSVINVKYQTSNVESQTTAHRPQTPALVPERTTERGKAVHAKGVHSDSDSLPSGKPSTPKVPIVAPEHSLPSGKASIVIVSAGASAADRESPTSNLQSPISNSQLLLAAWWLAYLTLYALRLPVTYQHGRYQMPVIPFFILLGLGGTAYLLRPAAQALLPRVASRATLLSIMIVSVAFLGLGARAYAADVAFIQGEMVATAHWLEEHTSPDSLIAVHDIGAVGYFTPRPLLDLAGLVTPEVIPFIADETRLLEFMQQRGAEYVVFFPDWSDAYQRMAHDPRLEPVHTTGFAWTLSQGRANMTIYRLRSR